MPISACRQRSGILSRAMHGQSCALRARRCAAAAGAQPGDGGDADRRAHPAGKDFRGRIAQGCRECRILMAEWDQPAGDRSSGTLSRHSRAIVRLFSAEVDEKKPPSGGNRPSTDRRLAVRRPRLRPRLDLRPGRRRTA